MKTFFPSKAFHNLPKLGFWVWKYTISQPWARNGWSEVNINLDTLAINIEIAKTFRNITDLGTSLKPVTDTFYKTAKILDIVNQDAAIYCKKNVISKNINFSVFHNYGLVVEGPKIGLTYPTEH
jgi:hypothetical protein